MSKRYTQKEIDLVKKWYPKIGGAETALKLQKLGYNRSYTAILNLADKLRLKSGIRNGNHRLGLNISPVKKQMRSRSSQIKPVGQVDGFPVTCQLVKGVPRKFIHIGRNKQEPLHRYLWNKANGDIPKNKVIVFKDLNPMNCVLENLEMLTRSEMLKKHFNHKADLIHKPESGEKDLELQIQDYLESIGYAVRIKKLKKEAKRILLADIKGSTINQMSISIQDDQINLTWWEYGATEIICFPIQNLAVLQQLIQVVQMAFEE